VYFFKTKVSSKLDHYTTVKEQITLGPLTLLSNLTLKTVNMLCIK